MKNQTEKLLKHKEEFSARYTGEQQVNREIARATKTLDETQFVDDFKVKWNTYQAPDGYENKWYPGVIKERRMFLQLGNYTKDASRLAFSLTNVCTIARSMQDFIEEYADIAIIKEYYGKKYIQLRAYAVSNFIPLAFRANFGSLTAKRARVQLAFNRGDFKSACRTLKFDPGKISKSDPKDRVISTVVEQIGRGLLRPEQLLGTVISEGKFTKTQARQYIKQYRFIEIEQGQRIKIQDFQKMSFGQKSKLKKEITVEEWNRLTNVHTDTKGFFAEDNAKMLKKKE